MNASAERPQAATAAGSLARRLRKWLAAGCAAVVIALAVLLGLFRLFAPQLSGHHAQIEAWAGTAIGLPVSIGRLDARWRLRGPELQFFDARILSPDRSATLIRAASGSVGISLWRLAAHFELEPSRVTLNGARIAVERAADGRLRLLGQDRRPAVDWSLAAMPEGRLELLNCELAYHDSVTGGGPWRFAGLEVRAERAGHSFRAEGELELPAALGDGLKFTVDADMAGGGIQLFAHAKGIDLPGWSRLLPARVPVPAAGHGDVAFWAAFDGAALERLSVDADLAGVASPAQPPGAAGLFVYDRLAGRFDWDRTVDGWVGAASGLTLERDGFAWPAADLLLRVVRTEPAAPPSLHAEASFLRMEDVLPAIPVLTDQPLLARIADFAPRGVVRDLEADYAPGPDGMPRYRIRASFEAAGVQPVGRLPGLAGLGGTVEATESGGRAELASNALDFTLEPMFRQPLHVDVARGALTWRRSDAGWRIASDAVVLENEDARTRSSVDISLPAGGGRPIVDLDTVLTEGHLENFADYLPVGILRPKLAAWLERAVVAGRVTEGRLELNGPLDHFPFDDGGGELRARFAVKDATLDYARGWPLVEGLGADLEFVNASLRGEAREGRLLGNRVVRGQAAFDDVRTGRLHLEGQTEGPLQQVDAFIAASPLERALGSSLARVEVHAGEALLDLDIDLPIKRIADRRVDAALTLRGAVLGATGVGPRFEAVNGTLRLDDGSLAGGDVQAMLFGRPVDLEVEPGAAPGERAVAVLSGRIDGRNLAEDLRLPLAGRLRGETAWQATAQVPARGPEGAAPFVVRIASTLEGLAVELPAPFAKPADAARPLAIDFRFPAPDRLDVGASWGELLRTRVHLDRADTGWRLIAGAARLGGGAPALPENGFTVQGSLPVLRLEDWLALRGGKSGTEAAAALKSARLELGDLYAFGQRVPGPVALSAERGADEWLVQIESGNVAGAVFLPFDPGGDAPVLLRMERLLLVEADPQASDDTPPPDPRRLPAFDVQADQLALGARQLGAVEAALDRVPDGLTLSRLSIQAPSFKASATGDWSATAGGQRSRLELELESDDVGETLTALGYGDAIEGDAGSASFELRWPGPPTGDVLEHLSGTASVHIEDGQLNDVEPGAGRVFGLLSVSALPRRIGLDFRDVFDKGLAFDRIAGDFAIEDGHAYTSNLLLEGPAADIGIVGRAGLADRDYDQTAVVSANIGTSLPIAGFLAGGPPVAAAMLLFSQIFKKPLQGMTQVYYHVDGSWDDPKVERVAAARAPAAPGGGSP